jgi:hypothetical protein
MLFEAELENLREDHILTLRREVEARVAALQTQGIESIPYESALHIDSST